MGNDTPIKGGSLVKKEGQVDFLQLFTAQQLYSKTALEHNLKIMLWKELETVVVSTDFHASLTSSPKEEATQKAYH